MNINPALLHLCAAILEQEPLSLLMRGANVTKDQLTEFTRRVTRLKGVMPDEILTQVVEFYAELVGNKGGAFQFVFANKESGAFTGDAMASWTRILKSDAFWLTDSGR